MITNILCATNSFTASIPRKVEALFHKGVPVKLNNFTDETLGVSFQNSLQNFLTTFYVHNSQTLYTLQHFIKEKFLQIVFLIFE